MVESAWSAVRWGDRFGDFYERVARRRGDQKAVVVVANKMLKIVWVMLVRREPYGNVNGERYGRKLNRIGVDV